MQKTAEEALSRDLNHFCQQHGFPIGEEFKWSPGRKHWMRSNLVGERRKLFFKQALLIAKMHNCKAIVVAQDCNPSFHRAHCQLSPADDAIDLLVERANFFARRVSGTCRLVIDNPGGNQKDGRELTKRVSKLLRDGTRVNKLDSIESNLSLIDSKSSRILQLADLVTSCTCAAIAGESRFAIPMFRFITPLLDRHPFHEQIGGVGLKIHPVKHANLYHWLCGDQFLAQGREKINLPTPLKPYYLNPAQDSAGIA